MIDDSPGALHLTLADTTARLDPGKTLATLLDTGEVTVELYMPRGYDGQTPHDRDEIYVVVAGQGRFTCGDTTRTVGPGDLLQVPAHVAHRFDHFDPGFTVWVIFYGPVRPK
jgi:mannose-6-phosphate isomerase-like protein (cupin superfamily)